MRDRSRPWSILPRRTASQKGITCSTRGPWRGQDDRLRRSSRTPSRVASIPPWPCTTRAERSNAGPSFRSAFERGQVHLDQGKHPGRRQCPSRDRSASLTVSRSLPVHADKQIFSKSFSMSQTCQKTSHPKALYSGFSKILSKDTVMNLRAHARTCFHCRSLIVSRAIDTRRYRRKDQTPPRARH